jgi:hypothetical protein
MEDLYAQAEDKEIGSKTFFKVRDRETFEVKGL